MKTYSYDRIINTIEKALNYLGTDIADDIYDMIEDGKIEIIVND